MLPRKSLVLALTAILMWSTAGTAFKLALRDLSFAQLLLIASHVAWITILLFMLITGIRVNWKIKNLGKSALGGLMNPFLYYLILLKAYSLLPAQLAQPLNYTWPVMLAILSVPFLKQKLKWFDFLAILISFSGVLVISLQGEFSLVMSKQTWLGIALATGSSILWAGFWIFNLKDQRDEHNKLFFNFLTGAILITIWVLLFDTLPTKNQNWLPAVYVGLTEMAIAFLCWLTALKHSNNNARLGNLVFISPFLALFFIHLILKEDIYITTFAGLLFIVGGVLLQQTMTRYGKQGK